MEIHVGDYVEICSNEDGFLGSYFTAKVLKRVGKYKFMVEYIDLVCDEDDGKPLTEVVRASYMRPCPPQIQVSGFDVLDKVDAFDNDGWWIGRITGSTGSWYNVYFDSSGDEIPYPVSRLRVHHDWENGQWVLSQRKNLER
ncbi:hypothetical protein L1049_000572 [Liquidambar formosana]|uniref:Agenet domain-containing protein n=1 Tax=Liquidambar formosana TaxID=63359 RepID=A0AAP0N9Y7_LIQFO